MKKCKLIPAVVGMMAMFASCTDEVPAIPDSELYTREWVKKFGAVNPDQDWNAATSAGVDVTTDAPARVQITARIQGKNYLLADYADVSGTRTLKFDIPKGVKEVAVISGSERYTAPIGGKVSFAASGREILDTKNPNITAEVCAQEDWWVLPMLNATIFRRKMPEGTYNADRKGVSVDFSLKFATHDFIVRPLFWQTYNNNEFGFFYYDNNGEIVHIPIYKMDRTDDFGENNILGHCPAETRVLKVADFRNDADMMACLAENGVTFKDWQCWNEVYNVPDLSAQDNFNQSCTGTDDHNMTMACRQYLEKKGIKYDKNSDIDHRFNYVYRWRFVDGEEKFNSPDPGLYQPGMPTGSLRVGDGVGIEIVYTVFNPDFSQAKGFGTHTNMLNNVKYDDNNYPALITKGIKVHIDDIERTYGGYIKRGDDRYMYSISSENEKNRWAPKEGAQRTVYRQESESYDYAPSDMEIVPGKRAFRAATWVGEKYNWRYMSFEDGVVPDATYNNSSCDFDLQDFVFVLDGVDIDDPVDKVIEEDKPEPIKWLIACEDLGGKDDFDFNDVVFEVEYVAGSGKAIITPLAAGGTLETYLWRYNKQGEAKQLTGEWHGLFSAGHTEMVNTTTHSRMAESFDIEVEEGFSIASPNGSENYRDVMGGFFLKIGEEEREVTPPVKSEAAVAPQMILIFQPEGEPWLWPRERMAIDQAYEGFTKWMTDGVFDAVKGDNIWSRKPNKSCVVERKR